MSVYTKNNRNASAEMHFIHELTKTLNIKLSNKQLTTIISLLGEFEERKFLQTHIKTPPPPPSPSSFATTHGEAPI
ncbi:MAG: hypothetical protein LBC12_00545 [Nitrososphaerota archaeon]|jgi:hypothetical protein|nr:hypothetical protein [Nitrososphaerota archaeon]